MSMNYSQKVAVVFEISGYILIIPSLFLMVIPLFGVLGGIAAFSPVIVFWSLIPLVFFVLGVALFVGYIKHTRGNLIENKILPMWFGTIFINLIPLAVTALFLYSTRPSSAYPHKTPVDVFPYLLILFWLVNVCLAASAAYFELEQRASRERLHRTLPNP